MGLTNVHVRLIVGSMRWRLAVSRLVANGWILVCGECLSLLVICPSLMLKSPMMTMGCWGSGAGEGCPRRFVVHLV
jgi:uncharacterized membrane protein